MSNNPDQNTQVSAEVEAGLPATSDAPAPERTGESPEPTAHLAALLNGLSTTTLLERLRAA